MAISVFYIFSFIVLKIGRDWRLEHERILFMKNKLELKFEKKYWWSIAAFGIPFIVSIVICAILGTYPFGENCVLHMDMYHQYCPFFMELRDKLAEGGSLLYSWNLGLGSDFLSLYAYYLASPLNWLLVLCPRAYVIEFMTVTIWIKIAFAGLFFFWFLGERFTFNGKDGRYHWQKALPGLVFATAYAFSGFVAAYSWNIMWMDSVALLPLIVMGLERLVKKNRPALYYVALSVSILSNFYISLIICMFLVLYFGVLLLEHKSDRHVVQSIIEDGIALSVHKNSKLEVVSKVKSCLRFAWYSLLAGGTGAILLIPEAIILSYSESADTTWPEAVEWYFGLVEELSRLCMIAERYEGNDHWPNLYCGTFTVLLVLLYVFNKRIHWKNKLPKLALLVLFILSFSNNYLDYIWHGLRFPNSLPGRQSFLFIFLMLLVGYETYNKRKGIKLWHVLVAELAGIGGLILSYQKTDYEITEELAFVITGIFMVCYGLCFALHRISKGEVRAMIRGLAFGLAMGEILVNMGITGFYSLDRASYLNKMEDYQALLEIAEKDALSDAPNGAMTFYRVEDYERKTKNDDSLYGYPSGTVFSSLMNINVSHFYQDVYMEGGRNYYCYNGATPLVSAMLSVKYMLSDNVNGENDLRELIASSNDYHLYENKYTLPLGFVMSEEAVTEWVRGDSGKIDYINALASVLGVSEDILVSVEVDMDVSDGETTIKVPEDGIYYGHHAKCSSDNLNIRINNDSITRWNKTSHKYLFEFGQCEAGDTIRITNSKSESVSFSTYRLNMEAVEEAYEILNRQTMVTEHYTDTEINGHITVEEAGRLIFSIPNQSGWTLYVDGVETEAISFADTFISVYLEEGEHDIELRYMTPGLEIGIAVTGACMGLFGLTMFLRRKYSGFFL